MRDVASQAQFGEAWERLFHPPVAHRGLWAPEGAPENSLAAFQAACEGDLDRVVRVIKLGGFVQAGPNFFEIPQVVNGCSDLMVEAFGDAGRHARSAVGVYRLPMNFAVEVDAVVAVR